LGAETGATTGVEGEKTGGEAAKEEINARRGALGAGTKREDLSYKLIIEKP
jgi:hypothetical protein